MNTPHATLRDIVRGLVVAALPTPPTYLYLPGNTDELPCFVIGRPNVEENGTSKALAVITVPVHILGRTLRDDDAQAELDDLADSIFNLFWKPPPVEGVSLRQTRSQAVVLQIAGTDIPAYTATVLAGAVYCS